MAGEPLATQEVAVTMGNEWDEAAAALERSGAVAEPAGSDRFWTLASSATARRAA